MSPLRKLPGPSVWSKPIFGEIGPQFREPFMFGKTGYCTRNGAYGTIRCVPIYLGELRVEIADPHWLNYVLQNPSIYGRGDYTGVENLIVTAGDSLLIADGARHKRLRRIASPAFRVSSLRVLVPILRALVQRHCSRWQRLAAAEPDGTVVRAIRADLGDLSLDVLGMAAFGHDYKASCDGSTTLSQNLNKITRESVPLASGIFPWYIPSLYLVRKWTMSNLPILIQRNLLIPLRAVLHSVSDDLKISYGRNRDKHTVNGSVESPDHKDEGIANGHIVDNEPKLSSLSNSVTANDLGMNDVISDLRRHTLLDYISHGASNGALDLDEAIDLVTTFIFAGHDTTSLAMTWTLMLLADYSESQARCREEADAFWKSKRTDDVFWEDLCGAKMQFPYIKATIQESLRLFPPVPYLSRKTLDDDDIAGYHVPKGTNIVLFMVEMHRDPSIWGADSLDFRPSRFLDPDVPLSAYMPFSDARHKCIGYLMAQAQLHLLLAHLVHKFTFSYLPGDSLSAYRAKGSVTTSPVPDVKLNIKLR